MAWIFNPGAAAGVSPGLHPTAVGTLIGGTRNW